MSEISGKLINLKVADFVNILASDVPAPGGGSAAALTGAMGAGLVNMVALLTLGRKKYEVHEALMKEIAKKTEELTAKLLVSVDRDTEAYKAVSAVFAMPKSTPEEKAARDAAMEEALKGAAIVPYEVMELCMASLRLAQKALGKSNTNAVSDLGVAALNLSAALKGAWLNVAANLEGIKDEIFTIEYRARGEKLISEGEHIADFITKGSGSA